MNSTVASSPADAAALEAVAQHHGELERTLSERVEELVRAAAANDADAADAARAELVRWCRAELLPHARAEEEALYPAGHNRDDARLLVHSMVAEHGRLVELITEVEAARDATRAAAAASALRALFESHLAKENELLLPLLAEARDVSLAQLLDGLHELTGAPGATDHQREDAGHCGGHGCGCGHRDAGEEPELDARTIPPEVRPATLLSAIDAVAPGASLVLLAPHDPAPLLALIEQRDPDAFAIEYLERGPEVWRLRFSRRDA